MSGSPQASGSDSEANFDFHKPAGFESEASPAMLVLVGLPLFTVAGNTLVLLGVALEKQLHTSPNWFIASLAMADLVVAVLVMPFFVYSEASRNFVSYFLVNSHFCTKIDKPLTVLDFLAKVFHYFILRLINKKIFYKGQILIYAYKHRREMA